MKLSDEIRKWADDAYSGRKIRTTKDLYAIADLIDREMVELPKDADGVPIHTGDKVRVVGRGNVEFKVDHITFFEDKTRVEADGKGEFAYSKPTDITHVRPDSWERIACDIETVVPIDDEGEERLRRELADRIRKLAEKEGKR